MYTIRNEMNIAPISSNNPLRNTYISAIKNWDENGDFIKSLDKSSIIYGVYFDARFLAAVSVTLKKRKETTVTDIHIVNGSNNHKELIQNYIASELIKILENNFGEDSSNNSKSIVKIM